MPTNPTAIDYAVEKNNVSQLKKLFKAGHRTGNNALLFTAVRKNQYDLAKILLEKGNLSPNYRLRTGYDGYGKAIFRYPLHWAVKNNNAEMIDLLCEYVATTDVKDSDDFTPIQRAQRYGHDECLKILEDRGILKSNLKTPKESNSSYVQIGNDTINTVLNTLQSKIDNDSPITRDDINIHKVIRRMNFLGEDREDRIEQCAKIYLNESITPEDKSHYLKTFERCSKVMKQKDSTDKDKAFAQNKLNAGLVNVDTQNHGKFKAFDDYASNVLKNINNYKGSNSHRVKQIEAIKDKISESYHSIAAGKPIQDEQANLKAHIAFNRTLIERDHRQHSFFARAGVTRSSLLTLLDTADAELQTTHFKTGIEVIDNVRARLEKNVADGTTPQSDDDKHMNTIINSWLFTDQGYVKKCAAVYSDENISSDFKSFYLKLVSEHITAFYLIESNRDVKASRIKAAYAVYEREQEGDATDNFKIFDEYAVCLWNKINQHYRYANYQNKINIQKNIIQAYVKIAEGTSIEDALNDLNQKIEAIKSTISTHSYLKSHIDSVQRPDFTNDTKSPGR